MVENDGQMTHTIRHRFVPITRTVHPNLVDLVNHELSHAPRAPSASPGAAASRLELVEALHHHPQARPRQRDGPSL